MSYPEVTIPSTGAYVVEYCVASGSSGGSLQLEKSGGTKVYGGKVSANHTANFIEAMQSRKQPISDVWSHNRMLEICHLSNIAMRLGRELRWDPQTRDIIGDAQASAFLSRESRKGYEINM